MKKNKKDAEQESATAVNYNPPPGVKGVPYNYSPVIQGLTAAALISGELPRGLNLNPLTGALTGTPEEVGDFSWETDLTVKGEQYPFSPKFTVHEPFTLERFEDDESLGEVEVNNDLPVAANKNNRFVPKGGSGEFEFGISGDNEIDDKGNIKINEPGRVGVSVRDKVSGQSVEINLLVASQSSICGLAVEEDVAAEAEPAPCVDIITDCDTPVTIAFNALTLVRGIEAGEVAYREALRFVRYEGAVISNNNKFFAGYRSTVPDAFAVAENALDGRPFLIEFAVDASASAGVAPSEVSVGVGRHFDPTKDEDLLYEVVLLTDVTRKVELRKDGIPYAASETPILQGQQVGLAVYGDTVVMYVDGLVVFSVAGATGACSGADIVIKTTDANVIVGGRANNLIFTIDTAGAADEVGTIDDQTGLYTPSQTNVGLVRIKASNLTNTQAIYYAKVRVIKPAVKASFEKAMIEGVPIDMWVCGPTRYDDLPLRLGRDGQPDRNQVEDPRHLGTLAGSGRIETTPTRNEFRNDRGATSTSLTFDKVVISGAYLNVRDFATVKRLIPFMKELNSNGVRTLRQYSTGCQHKMRILMVWATPDCGDVTVYDAIEIFNGLSYTPFTLEVGQTVQSQIALTIEGFPNSESALFDFNQYDKHYHRIGA